MANSTLVTQEDLKTFYDTYVKPYLNGESLATMHFVGSQIGTGTKNVTVDIASRKRLICITKKSGVIVESKEIPTAVLATNDVIPLGNNASVVGTTPANNPTGYAAGTDMIDKEIAVSFNNGLNGLFDPNNTNNKLSNYQTIGLAADLSSSTGASVTYTGSNSFTITVTDSTLSVYLYADMDVSGGAGVAANIAYDGSTSGSSETDVQGAIDETKSALSDLNKGKVSATTDGTTSFATFFSTLFAQVDLSKISEKSQLRINTSIFHIMLIGTNELWFSNCYPDATYGIFTTVAILKSSNSVWADIYSGQYHNNSNTTQPANMEVSVIY